MGYIYLRKNLSNGKCYVGQTKDVKKRNRDWNNLNWKYGGIIIERARAKYGVDGFSFEILKECGDEEMNYWEKYYVKEYNSKVPNGYNSTEGGDSIYEITEETRKKMSIAQRGRKHTEESKAKTSAALKGRKQSPEHIAKVADALRGRKKSTEHKAKLSAAHRGKKRPDISAALKGKPNPKVAAALRGKYNTKCSKAVQALDKITGEVVFTFPSAAEAERQGYGNHTHICDCCRGERKTAYGFIWRFAS